MTASAKPQVNAPEEFSAPTGPDHGRRLGVRVPCWRVRRRDFQLFGGPKGSDWIRRRERLLETVQVGRSRERSQAELELLVTSLPRVEERLDEDFPGGVSTDS